MCHRRQNSVMLAEIYGKIKVGGTVKAHQGSEAVAHLAVPGKVKVQLQRVGNDAQPGQRGGNIA